MGHHFPGLVSQILKIMEILSITIPVKIFHNIFHGTWTAEVNILPIDKAVVNLSIMVESQLVVSLLVSQLVLFVSKHHLVKVDQEVDDVSVGVTHISGN